MSEDQSGVVTLKVRVSPEFREKIVDTAKQNNRSMNQEIVSRLEQSFSDIDKDQKIEELENRLFAAIDAMESIKDLFQQIMVHPNQRENPLQELTGETKHNNKNHEK